MLIYPLLVYTFSIHRTCIVSLVIYIIKPLYLSCVVYHAFNQIISYFSCLLHIAITCISHIHIIIFVFNPYHHLCIHTYCMLKYHIIIFLFIYIACSHTILHAYVNAHAYLCLMHFHYLCTHTCIHAFHIHITTTFSCK